jgi:hypothetical protein
MSFDKFLQEMGIYDGAKKHDTSFLKLCFKKLGKRCFKLEDIFRKNIDQKYIIYAYLGRFGLPATEAPPLEHRIKLLKFALARMVEEGLLQKFTTWKDGHVYYFITEECLKSFQEN